MKISVLTAILIGSGLGIGGVFLVQSLQQRKTPAPTPAPAGSGSAPIFYPGGSSTPPVSGGSSAGSAAPVTTAPAGSGSNGYSVLGPNGPTTKADVTPAPAPLIRPVLIDQDSWPIGGRWPIWSPFFPTPLPKDPTIAAL
ncbi:hypothetical protein [Deinococcus misasensis]|uniref:hypothetical protein n=1 Tax=Deinococcus misasensis TaxID=392413 RepID=UPI000554186E|nr:hypothetical protein [Deinococcus misasensis]